MMFRTNYLFVANALLALFALQLALPCQTRRLLASPWLYGRLSGMACSQPVTRASLCNAKNGS